MIHLNIVKDWISWPLAGFQSAIPRRSETLSFDRSSVHVGPIKFGLNIAISMLIRNI
jgi:hypothetical protein